MSRTRYGPKRIDEVINNALPKKCTDSAGRNQVIRSNDGKATPGIDLLGSSDVGQVTVVLNGRSDPLRRKEGKG